MQVNVSKVDVKTAQQAETLTRCATDPKVPMRLKPSIADYDEIFHVHLHIDKNVEPTVSPTRRIPFTIREEVETELERLQRMSMIEPAKAATSRPAPLLPFQSLVGHGQSSQ